MDHLECSVSTNQMIMTLIDIIFEKHTPGQYEALIKSITLIL